MICSHRKVDDINIFWCSFICLHLDSCWYTKCTTYELMYARFQGRCVNNKNYGLRITTYRTIFTLSSSEDSVDQPPFALDGFCERRLLGWLPLNPSSLAHALLRALLLPKDASLVAASVSCTTPKASEVLGNATAERS